MPTLETNIELFIADLERTVRLNKESSMYTDTNYKDGFTAVTEVCESHAKKLRLIMEIPDKLWDNYAFFDVFKGDITAVTTRVQNVCTLKLP